MKFSLQQTSFTEKTHNLTSCRLLVLVVFVSCIVYLLFQVNNQAYNMVFSDMVDLFMGYLQKKDALVLFLQQHGPHRQGVGAIVMLPVLKLANWDMRSLSYLTVLIMAMSSFFIILALWSKSIQLLPSIAIVILSLSLGSVELLTVTPNISHSAMPMLFSSLLFLLILRYRLTGLWQNIAILSIVMLSLFTGFGIFIFFSYFLVFSILLVSDLIRKEKIQKEWIALTVATYFVLIVSLIIFFMNYSYSKGEGCSTTALTNISDVLKYSFAVASIPLGGAKLGALAVPVGFTVLSIFSIAGLFALKKLCLEKDMASFAILLIVIASGAFVINVAIGRHCLGIDSAYASRYYQFTAIGIIGSLFALDFWRKERYSLVVNVISIILIGITLVFVNPTMKRMSMDFYGHKNNFSLCVEQGGSVHDCNTKYTIYPGDEKRLISLLSMIKASNND